MSFTSKDAVRAFEEHGTAAVPYKTVKAKLKEWGATAEDCLQSAARSRHGDSGKTCAYAS